MSDKKKVTALNIPQNSGIQIDIGISEKHRAAIAEGLKSFLADSYTLYLKTHGYHWNVTGPMFNTLHLMFETHYTELSLAVDVIAERIRALGHFAPASYAAFGKYTSIAEMATDQVPSALDMVADLVKGHEAVVRTARKVLEVSEAGGDAATTDMLTQRIALHEKTAWMLRSLLA